MPKNYYVILGIPPTSTLSDIKSAYRRLVKKFHPDYFGPTDSPFMAIQEAYSVLSDPQQRKKYDDTLNKVRVKTRKTRKRKPQPTAHNVPIEPLIPDSQQIEPLTDITGNTGRSIWSDADMIFNHFFDAATEVWDDNREQWHQPVIDIFLSKEQKRHGGLVRIQFRAQLTCPECRGNGSTGFYVCWRCFGSGFFQSEIPLLLNIPPNIPNNHVTKVPLNRYGLRGKYCLIRFKKEDNE